MKGSIIASCGHELTEAEGMGTRMSFAEYDGEGSRCVTTGRYCYKCASVRRQWLVFVEDEEQGREWIKLGTKPGRIRAKRRKYEQPEGRVR